MGFLFDEFLAYVVLVRANRLMVVIPNAGADVGGIAAEGASKGGSFCVDTKGLVKFNLGVAFGWIFVFYAFNGVVDLLEIAMFIGIFAAQVSNNVTVVKVEGNFHHTKADAALPEGVCCISWVVPRKT